MNIDDEIEFVLRVITHPVGYDLGLFGIMCIRSTDQGVWCVSCENIGNTEKEQCFPTAREAAEFFVKKRIVNEIGLDFEKLHYTKKSLT